MPCDRAKQVFLQVVMRRPNDTSSGTAFGNGADTSRQLRHGRVRLDDALYRASNALIERCREPVTPKKQRLAVAPDDWTVV